MVDCTSDNEEAWDYDEEEEGESFQENSTHDL